ncbi:uncharacterized protein TNCV_2787981 [Trichonephila clavipes]|uniref:Uncharacterized protein n=1 Tax=Trichonephila clavipes TaxID=2585209 RepID=A0A8X6VQ51_TRICX|nr:uncharacterized protein TNCV_2787981 [Trichonephila clavipes]
MVKFKETEQLDVLPGSGRKRVNTAVLEDIATTVVEVSRESLHGTVNVPRIPLRLIGSTTLSDIVDSESFPTAWPPRSSDLTPCCDFWLWGFLKDSV